MDSSSSINVTTVLSVCTGMYGLDLGFDIAAERRLGRPVRTICGVEREAYCCEVLASRMEEGHLAPFPVWSNLKTFDGRPWRGLVDWVVGGYPCQPFSQAGARRGTDDERHLWPDIKRIIYELGGVDFLDGCFFENVRGHLTLGLDTVAGELRGMGFGVAAGLFSAEEVGASHRRERVFILAVRPGLLADAANLPRHDDTRFGRSEQGTPDDRGAGPSVADSDGARRPAPLRWRGVNEQRQPEPGHFQLVSGGELAYSGSERSQRHCATGPATGPVGRSNGAEVPDDAGVVGLFAPGPDAFRDWARVLLAVRPDLAPALPDPSEDVFRECEAEAESELRRVVDGLAPRLERLRGCGNGVVPLEAAYAYCTLFHHLSTGGPLVYNDQ